MIRSRAYRFLGIFALVAAPSHAFIVKERAQIRPRNVLDESVKTTLALEDISVTAASPPREFFSGPFTYPQHLEVEQQPNIKAPPSLTSIQEFLGPVVTGAFLITSNTVGAGCLVLPELAAGPGLAATTGIFFTCYIVNLLSGLLLAEVAIKQRETSTADVPASFKEFAETTLNSEAATVISFVSMMVNGCLQAFGASRVGMLGSALTGGVVPPQLVSMVWASALIATVGTQSSHTLAKISSVCAAALFVSFGGLVVPGLLAVQDPLATFWAPGTAMNVAGSVGHAAPIFLMSMIFQNVVPTLTKTLNYNRGQVVSAIAIGSAIPLCMYLAWCFASLGGGVDVGGPLLTLFSLATLAGSSLGSSMSLSQEVSKFVGVGNPTTEDDKHVEQQHVVVDSVKTVDSQSAFNIPTAALAISVPLAAALAFAGGDGFTEALSVAGSFGSPLLYGAIPVAMAWNQRRRQEQAAQPDLVPTATLPCLGAMSMGFMGQEILQRAEEALAAI